MAPLDIAVILARGRPAGPGERRFLDWLSREPRFRLALLAEAAPPPVEVPVLSRALALEARLLPPPDGAPALASVPVPAPVPLAEMRGAAPFAAIVDFSMGAEALALAGLARDGLWRLSSYAEAAGFATLAARAPVAQITLLRHRDGKSEPIGRGAYPLKFLASRNTAFLREKSVQILQNALARLHAGTLAPEPAIDLPATPVPGAWGLPRYTAGVLREGAVRVLRRAAARLGRRPGMFRLRLGRGDLLSFDPARAIDIEPVGNRYIADPFLFENAGVMHLFYEDYDYATRKGRIGVARIDGDRMVPLGTALHQPYHLSYPLVFRHGDEILMMPESSAAGRIEVWRATRFPLDWELAATALEGTRPADPVLFRQGARWWLFVNLCNDSFGDQCSELHLFAVDGPALTRVEAHPLNPVVIDARTARGAGRVQEVAGRLYRPSPDYSSRRGF